MPSCLTGILPCPQVSLQRLHALGYECASISPVARGAVSLSRRAVADCHARQNEGTTIMAGAATRQEVAA